MKNTIRLKLGVNGLQFMEPLTKNWRGIDRETATVFLYNIFGFRKRELREKGKGKSGK